MTNKHIYLAGGCFWGTEHFFKQIAGIVETEVGFANGQTDNPTYEQVYTDTTGYAETVHVVYDADVVSLDFLLSMFFVAIDPTSLNKQGHDEGTRYRTGIYYTDEGDLPIIEKVYAEEQSKYQQPLVVEKLPLRNFYSADEYHQDYLDKHPDGYCHLPKALFDFARKAKDMNNDIKTTELIRTSQSWDGVQLPDFPKGKPELTVLRMVFPVGAVTGWHHHTAVNYGIVEQGDLTIVCQDGNERTFHEGEPLVEVVGTIHRGENRGKKPVILNMFYFSAPGAEITIQHPELEVQPKEQKTEAKVRPIPTNKEEARVQKLVLVIGKHVLPRRQIVADLGLRQKSRKVFIDNYLKPTTAKGYIDFAYPLSPNKPEQAYKLTAKGMELYNQLTE